MHAQKVIVPCPAMAAQSAPACAVSKWLDFCVFLTEPEVWQGLASHRDGAP